MRLLLDTHLLLWVASDAPQLSANARDLVSDRENRILFSSASLWEITIKRGPLARCVLPLAP